MKTLNLLAIVEATSVTGPAKNLLDFCRTARALNLPLKPHIVTFTRGEASNGFVNAVNDAGVPLTCIPERGRFDLSVIPQLKSLVAGFKPDILQTHAVKSHFLLAWSGLYRRTPWVAFHHGYTTTDLKVRLYNQLDRWSLRKPARIVTVSQSFEQQLTSTGVNAARITILQNSVTPEWVARVESVDAEAARQSLGIEPSAPAIVAIGRMSLEKAHSDLILAFHIVRKTEPAARLVLVGEGPERDKLKAMAGANVIFMGQTPDVSPYYAMADVMVLPSLTEGSPNVLLEAMASGVPSVATNVGGIPEIVKNEESALLVPPRNPQLLAQAILRILTDPALADRLEDSALACIASTHTVEARARKLLDLYQTATGR